MMALELDEQTRKETLKLAVLYISNETMLEEAKRAIIDSKTPLDEDVPTLLDTANLLFASSSQPKTIGLDGASLPFRAEQTTLQAGDLEIEGYRYPSTTFVMGKNVLSIYPESRCWNRSHTESSRLQLGNNAIPMGFVSGRASRVGCKQSSGADG